MDRFLIDLATNGAVLQASDEFLNPAERLLDPLPPVTGDGRIGSRGRWLDGWETRRIRPAGHEWVIVRLGRRGVVRSVTADTTHVTNSLPAAFSVEAIDLPGGPNLVELLRNRSLWTEVIPRSPIGGAGAHRVEVEPQAATHLRLVIYPDGGVARLRAHGEPLPPDDLADRGEIDLASHDMGGLVVDASDARTSPPNRMLGAGDPKDHDDGWVTRRRRGPGNEWAIVRLGGPGRIERIVVDTRKYPGDSPAEIAVSGSVSPDGSPGDWIEVVPKVPVEADARNRFEELPDGGPYTHLRLDLHPDGAIGRFRAFGRAEPDEGAG